MRIPSFALLLVLVWVLRLLWAPGGATEGVSYAQFLRDLRAGRFQEVTISNQKIIAVPRGVEDSPDSRAKHVVVYERTVNASAQFAPEERADLRGIERRL